MADPIKVTGIVLKPEQRRWLLARAKRWDRSMSWVVRQLIVEAMAAEQQPREEKRLEA